MQNFYQKQYKKQCGCCIYCDQPLNKSSKKSGVDHVVPKYLLRIMGAMAATQKQSEINKLLACKKCNNKKGNFYLGSIEDGKWQGFSEEFLYRITILQLYKTRELGFVLNEELI